MNGYLLSRSLGTFLMTDRDSIRVCPKTTPIAAYHSGKAQKPIFCTSSLQVDCCHFLEFAPNVMEYSLLWKADVNSHTPFSFFVARLTSGRQLIIGCEPHHLAIRPDNQKRYQSLKAESATHGHEFCLVTDRELTAGFRLENIKLLSRFAGFPLAARLTDELFTLLSPVEYLSIASLATLLRPNYPEAAHIAILKLIGLHLLHADLDSAYLSEQALVRITKRFFTESDENPLGTIFGSGMLCRNEVPLNGRVKL